jgi:hypothetical protein
VNFTSPDPQPGDDSRQAYIGANEVRDAARNLERFRRAGNDLVSNKRRPNVLSSEQNHPFKIYLAQLALGAAGMAAAYPDPTTWWRTFLVRSGRVLGYAAPGSNPAVTGSGIDGYDTDPDNDYYPATGYTPVQVASGATWYFWLETSVSQQYGTIQGGALYNTNAAGAMAGTNVTWPSFPQCDGFHYLVASIDTATNAPYGPANVRQILRADVTLPWCQLQECDLIDNVTTTGFRMYVCSAFGTEAFTVNP